MSARTAELAARLDALLPDVLARLDELVAVPSISVDPAHRADVLRSARQTAEAFSDLGVDVSVVSVDGGQPAVLGRSAPVDGPTVLLYAHHDVQPTGDLDAWTSPPFTATRRGERLFGRGSADDKAGIGVHLAALAVLGPDLGCNVRILVEGEEEIGSPSLPKLLVEHREALAADVVVVADSVNWAVGTPSLTTSLRGILDLEVAVGVLDHDLHSGAWGGAVPDAAGALVRALATLYDADGAVAVRGLDGPARTPAVEYDEQVLRADAGVPATSRLPGRGSLTSRLWRQPSITLIGTDLPPVGEAAHVLRARATARLSVRIPPGVVPEAAVDAVTAHLRAHVPHGAVVETTLRASAHPVDLGDDSAAHAVMTGALRDAWDAEPVEIGVGGSIPLIHLLAETFSDATVLVTAVEDPDTRAHGIDESLHLGEFRKACLAEALLLDRIASGLAV
ncbi:M20/M25/M40 family metallo-hydrolase [Nocardioides nitrophenolicus]|uniref:M20/M25/M40 family metallo-hydrolase n=1 Tax=Nocardioides nitrophenolicus TaxID=60489 RepID=UPI00195F2654|nr:M20/M25/M40 family metallo-hydrolase [Nocardioides nitrophenolicus]MBM7520444.1 acetylornithine deacetylase/succinyl-diaminopimelate desuccinylase-like protein [Nocardioides nitrophenolicus]